MKLKKKVKYLDMTLRILDIPTTLEQCEIIIKCLDVIKLKKDRTTFRDITDLDTRPKLTTWVYEGKHEIETPN